MNAAARHINQTTVFNGKLLDLRFSFTTWLQIVLLFTVFWSAVAVVYITDQYRFTCAEVEQADEEHNRLDMQWGRFLLERGSLTRLARVQNVAAQKFGMVLPDSSHMVPLKWRN